MFLWGIPYMNAVQCLMKIYFIGSKLKYRRSFIDKSLKLAKKYSIEFFLHLMLLESFSVNVAFSNNNTCKEYLNQELTRQFCRM